MQQHTLTYQADGLNMRGELLFEPAAGSRAAVLVFPEAFGLGENDVRRERELAATLARPPDAARRAGR